MRPRLVLAILTALAISACSSNGATSSVPSPSVAQSASTAAPPVDSVELTILAAASLEDLLADVKKMYEQAHAGTTLTISTDSSSALEAQIEQGAPADVFLSADTANPAKLVSGGFAAGEAVAFAGNKLTIVVPADNPAGITSPADLADAGLKVIASGDEVPITDYAEQLVQNLANEPGYPPDFAAAYTRNIASKEDNVKAVIAKIELGEGDAAIVYATDATASTKVTQVPIPDSANVHATYAGVVVAASAHQEAARTFLGWLVSPEGQAILTGFGFLPRPT